MTENSLNIHIFKNVAIEFETSNTDFKDGRMFFLFTYFFSHCIKFKYEIGEL